MRLIIRLILVCSVGCLGWVCPLTAILFAQQLDALHAFTTGNWLRSDLSGNALQAIIPDFQVNENAGGSDKFSIAMGADENGNFVVAWSDCRDGYWRIYGQRFNRSGMALGVNFQVDDDAGNLEQGFCDIAMKENGEFVIVWLETNSISTPERENDIVARMFDGSGIALSSSFKVTEEPGLHINSPFIAMDISGSFMIVWADLRYDYSEIFAQRYDSTGSPLGYNFRVTDKSGGHKQYPQIVVVGDDEFMVVWQDQRSGNASIYAQRYDKIGTALGPNFWLAGGDGSVSDFALTANKLGQVVVVWDEWKDSHRDLFGLLYNYPEPALSESFLVNDDTLKRGFANESVAVGPLGDFCVTWHGDEEGRDVIFARWFHRDGTAKGSSRRVNDGFHVAYHVKPSIIADENGDFLISWEDFRNGQPDIYAQRVDSSANTLGTNFKINDDVGSADQSAPNISANGNGDFVVAWGDYRESSLPHNGLHSNIYVKRYNASGAALGKDLKVNDNPMGNYIWDHKVAIAPAGQFMVTWYEYRNGNRDIYAQFFSVEGVPVGSNILVSADTGKVDNYDHDIAADANGNFVIVWSSSSYEEFNFFRGIFARRYDSFGTPIGGGIKVAEKGSYPVVAMAPNGDFMVVWKATDIYARVYNSAGIPQGTFIKVNPSGWEPTVTVDGNGNYFIVWREDVNFINWEIYARRYDRYGKALGDKFKVNDVARGKWQANLSVSSDQDGHVLVVWNDNRQGYWDIMAQRYDVQGQPVGGNFCPTQHTILDQEWPSAQVVNCKIYLAWQTNHVGGTGYDIWANVLDWHSPVVKAENISQFEPPISFSLSQNYPNPANPSTNIKYGVPERELVTIKIFNLSGREVLVLVHETQSPGLHEIVWDGKDARDQVVASGIYLYQLKSGRHSAVRRMVLLR